MENVNLLTVFTTGLLTGGLTCMAVQGGLLAATLAQHEQEKLVERFKISSNKTSFSEAVQDSRFKNRNSALPIISFLVAKLVAYTGLGFFLGWLGSFFTLSIQTQVLLQILVAFFMIGTALNMLNVHPVFRYFVIQPPRFLTRFIRRQSKKKDIFVPAFLGALTIFIPCGTTQAMMALAIASGNPILGAVVLFTFVLGTSPVFFLLGYLTTRLGDILHERFTKVAAYAIVLLAIFNINNAVALSGSKYTIESGLQAVHCAISFCSSEENSSGTNIRSIGDGTIITITDGGYFPNTLSVKHGQKVTLKIVNNDAIGCAQAFTIPQLNVQKVVPMGSSDTVTFTAPDKPTELAFMCSMGMYRGTIKVI